jgi:predicted MFS family arabinose efflux permease
MTTLTSQELIGRTPEGAADGMLDSTPVGVARPKIITVRLLLVFAASVATLTSFYLMMSVTPMFAVSAGAGRSGAGLATGVLMLGAVLAEVAAPALMNAYGSRRVFASGAVLLGAPALLLLVSDRLVTILAVSFVRGLGFGLTAVVTGALVVHLVPRERRGEGLGLFGVVDCVPAVLALPSGVWLAGHAGYALVIDLTAATALASLACVLRFGGVADRGGPARESAAARPMGLADGLRRGEQRRLALIFAASTVSAGVVAAFLPLAAGASGNVAALGLFVQATAATISRWVAGWHGDRIGHATLLIPGLVLAASGMALLVWVASPVAVIAGMAVFGTGFGISQTATFALMVDRVPPSGYGMASALWNLAYDAGYGAGPAAFGVVVVHTGYPAAFGLTGVLMLAALVPALRERRPAGP